MDTISLIEGDALLKLDQVKDKSIQTICIDPPYNIGKSFMGSCGRIHSLAYKHNTKNFKKKLKDNGSFLLFHNDMETDC